MALAPSQKQANISCFWTLLFLNRHTWPSGGEWVGLELRTAIGNQNTRKPPLYIVISFLVGFSVEDPPAEDPFRTSEVINLTLVCEKTRVIVNNCKQSSWE